ncbi:MAG: Hsp20 family protein [Bacillus sp. (in: firmicutes)]
MSTDKNKKNLPKKFKKHDSINDFVSNMDQLFGGKPMGGLLQTMDDFFQNSSINRSFPIEMIEEQHAYIIKAILPGIKKQQIHIEAFDQSLFITVRNELQRLEQDEKGHIIQSQRSMQTTKRNVTFVKPINAQKIVAAHNDGLLEITVPKVKGREIQIIE